MIKIIIFLLFITGLGFCASYLAQNSGQVTMFWFDYRIETSVAFLLFSAIIFAFLFAFLLQLIFAPARFLERCKTNKLKRGISELTYSVAALAASDILAAEAHTKKVEKLLGRTPLAILLNAQIAKTKGDEVATNALLEQLLQHKETNYLAARSLSDNASKHDNLPKALELAKQANALNPRDNLSALQLLSLQARMQEWAEAEATLNKAKLPRSERKRLRALVNITHGEELLAAGRDADALTLAKSALSTLPCFPPAAALAARAYHENDSPRHAFRALKRAWQRENHPVLLEALADITAHEPSETQEKMRHKLRGVAGSGFWECRLCTKQHKIWHLTCENCHGFDTLEWK